MNHLPHLPFYVYCLLSLTAFIAGTIDTLAGGGGLITVPVILMTGMNPIMALGTIKFQGAICELSASLHFMQKHQMQYQVLIRGFIFTIIGATIGTILLQITPIKHLNQMIPWLLLSVLIYYIWSRRQKNIYTHEIIIPNNKKFFIIGTTIGFYNGFFGPGTGSIWAITLMKTFKLSLQKATMYAKPLNLAGNLTALSIFIVGGKVDFAAAIVMGIGSYLGGKWGASLVIHRNDTWLKTVFLSLMTISTALVFYKYYGHGAQ